MSTQLVAKERERSNCPAQPLYSLWRKPFRVILSEAKNPPRFRTSQEKFLAQNPRTEAQASASG